MKDMNGYYQTYYDRMGDNAYTGSGAKNTSRMLVFQDWFKEMVKPGSRVLDIGCGDAVFASLMPEYSWYGIDINVAKATPRLSPDSGEVAVDSSGKPKLVQGDLMETPYSHWEAGYFDAIITSEVLEHLWDLREVHKEAKRLLKREGTYFVSTPNFDWITNHLESFRRIMQVSGQHWTFEHIRHYNKETHEKFLNDVGFVVEKHTGADAHFCPVFANAARAVRDNLRKQGVEVDEARLHQWIGEGVPLLQHTVCLAARKA